MGQQEAILGSEYADDLEAVEKPGRIKSALWFLLVSVLLLAALWFASTQTEYTPGSDLGYNLGLVGGVAMLLALLYPVAKRVRFMNTRMHMGHWFTVHMLLGTAGPVLIMFHSKFVLESINGTLAFWSMCSVLLSGFIGRYIHTKLQYGLQHRHNFLQGLKEKMGVAAEAARSKFRYVPEIDERLQVFEVSVLAPAEGLLSNLWIFLALPFRFECTYLLACQDIKRAVNKRAQKKKWNPRKTRRRIFYGKAMARAYLEAVRSVARASAYERLFALWHLVHIPLLFWLAITGAIHVLAVHMY
ncbi:MAG: hypothetical protein E2O38_05710 [Proteobacteria bacterium]|nr:MAG: hypothetical protein E2O38_05710 [Pseudomonadota bacterium]